MSRAMVRSLAHAVRIIHSAFLSLETGVGPLETHSVADSPTRHLDTLQRASCSGGRPPATAAAHRSAWYTRPGLLLPPTTVRGATVPVTIPSTGQGQRTLPLP